MLAPLDLIVAPPSEQTWLTGLSEELHAPRDPRSSWSEERHTEKYWGCILKVSFNLFLPCPPLHLHAGKALTGNSATPSPVPPSWEEQETFQNFPPAAQRCYCFSQKGLVPQVSLLNLPSSHTRPCFGGNWEGIFKMDHLCSQRVKSLSRASGLPLKVKC